MRSGFLSGPYGIAETSGYRDNRGDERERAGGDWLNGPPEGSFLFWCVAWWSRGCCGLSAVLRCGGAAPWSGWILRVWVVSGVCERQVQSTTRVRSSGSEPRSNPTPKNMLKICVGCSGCRRWVGCRVIEWCVSRIAAALPTKEVPSRLAMSARLLTVIRSNGVRMEVDDEWDVGGG